MKVTCFVDVIRVIDPNGEEIAYKEGFPPTLVVRSSGAGSMSVVLGFNDAELVLHAEELKLAIDNAIRTSSDHIAYELV